MDFRLGLIPAANKGSAASNNHESERINEWSGQERNASSSLLKFPCGACRMRGSTNPQDIRVSLKLVELGAG